MNQRHNKQRTVEQALVQNAESLEKSVPNYYRWNLSLFPIKKNARILDIGCGGGLCFNAIMEYSPAVYLATDFSPDFLTMLNKKMAHRKNCRVEQMDIFFSKFPDFLENQTFDYIFCFDVLEHLSDDTEALRKIGNIIKRTGNGLLFLRVPAISMIYGKNDEAIGHLRRYSASSLRKALLQAQFRVESIKYQNFVGILAWFIIGKLFQRSFVATPGEGRLFNAAVPLLRRLEKVSPPPIGLSLNAIASLDE